jgi:hypothetical protein
MRHAQFRLRSFFIITAIVAVGCLIGVGLWGGVTFLRARRAEFLGQVTVGSTADEIIRRVGFPGQIYQADDQLPAITPTVPHSGPLFVYQRGAADIFYVYFDEARCVTAVRWRPN